jgi:hypothetical protein
MLARCSVLSLPPPASGIRKLLLYIYSHSLNRLESTLPQVFILENLKPFGIINFEKQEEGCQLWLTKCYKKIPPAAKRLPARQASLSVIFSPFSIFAFPFSALSFRSARLRDNDLPFSVHTSKFRIPQVLCLPFLRKHRGVGRYSSHFGTTVFVQCLSASVANLIPALLLLARQRLRERVRAMLVRLLSSSPWSRWCHADEP